MKETSFRIEYDDQPDDVVAKISAALNEHGLTIRDNGGGDGYEDYTIAPPYVIVPEPDYEYEMFFDSGPEESVQIHGWYPIATDRIRNPEKIDHYLSIGLLRKYQKN